MNDWRGRSGTVFEIAKTPGGYADTPTILVSFNGTNGEYPSGDLIADANGNLFGTTSGGGGSGICPNGEPLGCGTVFEITGSDFVVPSPLPARQERRTVTARVCRGWPSSMAGPTMPLQLWGSIA
jgi:hypothetical protein